MERRKYTLSQDKGASPDMRIPSPQPIDKSKVAGDSAHEEEDDFDGRIPCQGTTPMSGGRMHRG